MENSARTGAYADDAGGMMPAGVFGAHPEPAAAIPDPVIAERVVARATASPRPPARRKADDDAEQNRIIEIAKRRFVRRVTDMTDILVNAQASLAVGQQFLFRIDKELAVGPKGGKAYRPKRPVVVTDPEEIMDYIQGSIVEGDARDDGDPGSSYYYLTTREPNNQALDSLLNRALGRARETVEMNLHGRFSLVDLARGLESTAAPRAADSEGDAAAGDSDGFN